MTSNSDCDIPVRRISPRGKHCFFGYYDMPAADAAGRHLCHQVRFRDRFPTPDDTAVLGWIPLPKTADDPPGELPFESLAETHAWNFQQGSMLQWLDSEHDTCIYNFFEHGQFGAYRHNVRTGARRRLPLPVANVSRDGTKALCINMARMFSFRPGYGYEEAPDPFAEVAAPQDDGVFLMDLATGNSHLLISLAEAVDFLKRCGINIAGHKVLVNHITFNPSSSRYMFLVRSSAPTPAGGWDTYLLTADTAGGGLRHHSVWGRASHYYWRNDDQLLIYAKMNATDKCELGIISDSADARQLINLAFFDHDGHCSYSRDLRWLLYDSYPDRDERRALEIYSPERGEGRVLGRFQSEAHARIGVDLRCDLHPRWMPDNRSLTFDSIHEGYRGLYWADLRTIMGQ